MKLLDFIFAARPMLHVPLWSVYLVSLHYHSALSGDRFQMQDFFLMLSLSLLWTAACYINQVYDQQTDLINDKLKFLQLGLISERQMMLGFLAASIAGMLFMALVSITALAIALQFFLLGYLYSAPPLRLKDHPLWGMVVNAYGCGFLVSCLVMPELTIDNSGLLGWDNPFYFSCAIGAVYALTAIVDRAGDAVVGKRTFAVSYGQFGALAAAWILLGASLYLASASQHLLLQILSIAALTLLLLCSVWNSPLLLGLAIKVPILLLTLMAGYFYPGYLVFIVVLIISVRLYYRKRFRMTYPELA